MPAAPAAFWGLSVEGWTAIAAVAGMFAASATLLLVIVGLFQLRATRREAVRQIEHVRRENRVLLTITACDRYDNDPVLDRCLRRLRIARQNGKLLESPSTYRTDYATVLNYLESLAIGIAEGLYIEEIVHDHNSALVKQHVEQYLVGDLPAVYGLEPHDYDWLIPLYNKWFPSPTRQQPRPRFRDRGSV